MDRGIVVIGGGPAGYVAGIRAAHLGGKVTVIEKDKLGGTCVNRGCIPTKFMLRSVETYQAVKNAAFYGISVSDAVIELAKMQVSKRKVVANMGSGVKGLLMSNKVEIISGEAKFLGPNQLEITTTDGKKETTGVEKVIVATGATAIVLPVPGANSPDIMGVEDLLELEKPPKSLIIIGGGVVGVELATVYAKLGCQVSLVEMMPHCLPAQDDEVAAVLEGVLKSEGVQVLCGTKVIRIEDTPGGKAVVCSCNGAEQRVVAEAVAVSIGYRPNSAGLGLEGIGVALERGRIVVNESMETNVPGIYAAGDVVGGMMLAYVAIAEGIVAAENATGTKSHINYTAVPQCIFTLPEVASVGLNEKDAMAKGYDVEIGRFPFKANGMAAILNEPRGLVKIVADKKYGQVLGAHIIGPSATLLIAECATAIKLEATVGDIIGMIHSHPSLTEAVWEAAADVQGKAIQYLSRKKH